MDTKETELNLKLAEWAGWRDYSTFAGFMHGTVGSDPPHSSVAVMERYFTQSLDACFKWLVPKLIEWSINNNDENLPEEAICAEVAYYDKDRKWVTALEFDKTPALALCLAIEKLIKV